jgi:hypothetical protein
MLAPGRRMLSMFEQPALVTEVIQMIEDRDGRT